MKKSNNIRWRRQDFNAAGNCLPGKYCKLLALLILMQQYCFGQSLNIYTRQSTMRSPDSVTLSAGIQFRASGWKQLWWGKHWRKDWVKPVSFPVFNLSAVAGGLTPIKKGGGHETKALRLKGGNGKEYVLRTINKSLDALVPAKFKGSFINDLVNDQVCTAHPYGPLVAAALAREINVLHTNPVMVFVPDDIRLGEFKTDFANKLCLFEERPSGKGWEYDTLINGADFVINSTKLFEELAADPYQQ